MHLCDEENTTFITLMASHYNKVMSFGLKSARATYQRLINKVFVNHIDSLIEFHINDTLVKTTIEENLISNLRIVFDCL